MISKGSFQNKLTAVPATPWTKTSRLLFSTNLKLVGDDQAPLGLFAAGKLILYVCLFHSKESILL